MNPFFAYLIKSSVSLALLYILFRLAMRNDKTHSLNRFLLLAILLLATVIPFLDFQFFYEEVPLKQVEVFREFVSTPVVTSDFAVSEIPQVQAESRDSYNLYLIFYISVILVLLVRLMVSIVRVMQIIGQAEKRKISKIVLAIVKDLIQPFTFFNKIILSEKDFNENKDIVVAHEHAHIKQMHAIDLVVCELFTVVHFFNPFMWLLRRDLKLVHEYQADQAVLNKGIDAKKYQMLVLEKSVGERRFAMANHFTQKPILKRIKMMQKRNKNYWNGIKLLLFIPVILLLLQAFAFSSCKTDQTKINGTYRFVSEEVINNGKGNVVVYDKQNSGLKTWSDKYVLWVNSSPRGQGGGELGGGTYKLSGNHYTENFQHHASASFRGVSMNTYLEMKGDTVIQIWPCDADFNYDKNNCVIHKYVRVD